MIVTLYAVVVPSSLPFLPVTVPLLTVAFVVLDDVQVVPELVVTVESNDVFLVPLIIV